MKLFIAKYILILRYSVSFSRLRIIPVRVLLGKSPIFTIVVAKCDKNEAYHFGGTLSLIIHYFWRIGVPHIFSMRLRIFFLAV